MHQLPSDPMRLVRAVAYDVARRMPRTDFDELVSAGTVGLMRAVDRYDAARGVAFTTYAVALIRGAILDDLRSQAWSTRTARSRARRITVASHQLAGRLGRGPAAREVAEHLGIDLSTYFEWQHAAEACRVVRFGPGDSASAPLEDRLADDAAVAPDEALEWEETVGELRGAVAGLSPRQREVISLYFKEQLTLREIGGLMGISEGRVSQIRKAALRALRLSLAAAPRPDRKPDRERRAGARVRHQKLPADAIQKGA